jgi:hypothetical protein
MCWLHCDANVQGPFCLSDSRTLFIFLDPRTQIGKESVLFGGHRYCYCLSPFPQSSLSRSVGVAAIQVATSPFCAPPHRGPSVSRWFKSSGGTWVRRLEFSSFLPTSRSEGSLGQTLVYHRLQRRLGVAAPLLPLHQHELKQHRRRVHNRHDWATTIVVVVVYGDT